MDLNNRTNPSVSNNSTRVSITLQVLTAIMALSKRWLDVPRHVLTAAPKRSIYILWEFYVFLPPVCAKRWEHGNHDMYNREWMRSPVSSRQPVPAGPDRQ
jgi:hypothetical protein